VQRCAVLRHAVPYRAACSSLSQLLSPQLLLSQFTALNVLLAWSNTRP
jgi:hypothetical protein